MYTVIIAEKKHFDAIEQNKLYFKPFLDRLNEDFAFCEWNPDGKNLYECVPELIKTVGRHSTWRAVILKDNSLSLCKNPYDSISYERVIECEEKNQLINPLDDDEGADNAPSAEADSRKAFEEWKNDCSERLNNRLADNEKIFKDALGFPFQRLMTCLCFMLGDRKSNVASKNSKKSDFFENVLDPENFEKYMADLERLYHIEQDSLKEQLRRECLDQMLPEDGALRKKGSMGIVLPTEVICFAERTTETGFIDDRVYWESHKDYEYSDFTGRNMYFDKMRFIVSDILPETHQNYRYDRIRFLYNLLLFSLNDVPSGTIHPRKLYCLESENDERTLKYIASAYVSKISNTIDLVDEQIAKIKRDIPKELTDTDSEKMFCTKVTVPVTPEKDFSEDSLYANQHDYGLFSDSYGDDATNWYAQIEKTRESVEKLVKQPRRALKRSVNKLDRECEVDYNMIRAMNSFQMDDVREYTDSEMDKMVSASVTNIFDISRYLEQIKDKSENVISVIKRRMKKKTNIILGGICLLLFLISFLPLIFTNRATVSSVSTSVLFTLVFMGLLLAVFLVTVLILRLSLKKSLDDFNDKVKEINSEVNASMSEYSDYLSCVVNVRRGFKVLNFSDNNLDKYDRDISIRKKHKTDMEKIRAVIVEKYEDFIDNYMEIESYATAPYPYDFGLEKMEFEYYPPYLPDDRVFIDYLTPGNKIELSSDFLRKITLRMEEIYD